MLLTSREIGQRIREIREKSTFSKADIATSLGIQETSVDALENGTLDPLPGDYILIIAKLLHVDFRYFISNALDNIEATTRQVFRALDHPTPSDAHAIRRVILFASNEAELELLLSRRTSQLPPTYTIHKGRHLDHGIHTAEAERNRLGLDATPIANIFNVLRNQGIRVLRHRLHDANVSGVTIIHPDAGIVVLVNYDQDLYRQYFSAAHEYAHVLFDRNALDRHSCIVSRYSTNELVEFRANAFAADFLLPPTAITKYPKPHSLEELNTTIRTIALDYSVNSTTVAIRLKNQGWITERTLESFKKAKPVVIPRADKRDVDMPLGLTNRQAERRKIAAEQGISTYYLELLRTALIDGTISRGRFIEMLDMTPDEAATFTDEIGLPL